MGIFNFFGPKHQSEDPLSQLEELDSASSPEEEEPEGGGLFGLFGRRGKKSQKGEQPEETANPWEDISTYAGTRVEVLDEQERLLFSATLTSIQDGTARLDQYSDTEFPLPADAKEVPVQLRGFHGEYQKAFYLSGLISPQDEDVWTVTGLNLTQVTNARAFFRLQADVVATMAHILPNAMREQTCKLLNLSIGGACIETSYQYEQGDRFLLKVYLSRNKNASLMFCQVLRITPKEDGNFEYGCRFIDLSKADLEGIPASFLDTTPPQTISQKKERPNREDNPS